MKLSYYIHEAGIIKAAGADRIDFFNRMSTNELLSLEEGKYNKTVFTSDKGRIISFAALLNFPGNTLILTNRDAAERLISHLDKYIIMDDVTLTEANAEYIWCGIYGEDAVEATNKLFNISLEGNNTIAESDGIYFFLDNYRVKSVNILARNDKKPFIEERLADAVRLDNISYSQFRIKHGIPGAGELNEQVNPMECGLNDYISFNKGCYIGQEVVARLDAQGKLPKQMVSVVSGQEYSANDKIYLAPEEWSGVQPALLQRECGFISSTANMDTETLGLGFIRSTNLDYNKAYLVKEDGREIKINISKII